MPEGAPQEITILDVPPEPIPETVEVTPNHIDILTQQLESGATSHFDAALVSLLQEVNANKDKSGIANRLISAGLIGVQSVGSKVAGFVGAVEAGALGQDYFTQKASRWLSERFLLNPDSVKAIPSHSIDAAKGVAGEVTKNIDPDIIDTATATNNMFLDFFRKGAQGIHDLISQSGGEEALKKGAEAAKVIQNVASQGTAHGVDATVDGINHMVVQPAVEGASEVVGWTSYLPSAAIGWILASGFTGGLTGVIRENKERNSFSHYASLIDEVHNFKPENNPRSFENDPRVKLAVACKQISNEPDKTKYSFTKEEWLVFAAATREARCSLLRSKTKAAQITIDEETSAIERKTRVVESIVFDTQAALAEEDRVLAGNILTQYDTRLTTDMNPLEKENALENTVKRKILRYSKTFVKSGTNATGLPTLWKAFRIAAKVVLPI